MKSLRARIQLFAMGVGLGILAFAIPAQVLAASAADHGESGGHGAIGPLFLMLAVVLLAAKLGNLVEKLKQPAVIGELLAGIVLAALGFFGVGLMTDIQHNEVIGFIAELGAVLLLFSIGLESNLVDLKKVGVNALLVAIIGVVAPFVLGTWVVGPIFFPEADTNALLFLGASMVATSVGITASVFKSMNILKTRAAQTVLGAAVIDDVLGLIVLAIVSALAAGGEISPELVATLSLKAFGFLVGAIVLGKLLAKPISLAFSSIATGIGMKLAMALSFALIFAYGATLVGLAPIVGAFAAGLLLDPIHFENFDVPLVVHNLRRIKGLDDEEKETIKHMIHEHQHGHVEDLIGNISLIFVPIFFVYTGLQVDFGSLLQPSLYVAGLVISLGAILTKMLAGIAAKGSKAEKLLVGAAMVPRGEVGLIFAATGASIGAIDSEMFSVIIMVVIVTTFIAPFMLKKISSGLKLTKA